MKRHFLAGLLAVPALLLLSIAVLHSSSQPAGAAAFVFQTDMYGSENVPAVDTLAYGFVRFFFNESRTAADYTVDVKGYSDSLVAGADIHRGAPGVNGPAVKHLADGGFIVTGGHMNLSTQDVAELKAGLWYVSLKTYEHPEGVLRGQIVLPPGFDPNVIAPPPPIGEQRAPGELRSNSVSAPLRSVFDLAPQPSVVEPEPAPLSIFAPDEAPPVLESSFAIEELQPALPAFQDEEVPSPAPPAPAPVLPPASPPSDATGEPAARSAVRPPNTGDGGLLP